MAYSITNDAVKNAIGTGLLNAITESITDTLTTNLNEKLNNTVISILESIAKTYNIDEKELKEKYVGKNVYSGDMYDSSEKKKRGRKKKQKDEFIETEEYEYEGVKYLVDGNNNVYTYNIEEPMLIGERLVDGTIKKFV